MWFKRRGPYGVSNHGDIRQPKHATNRPMMEPSTASPDTHVEVGKEKIGKREIDDHADDRDNRSQSAFKARASVLQVDLLSRG